MEKYQVKIGCLVHIPNVGRGQLKYVGPVDTKPGIYVGVDLLANIGKNDGSFKGKKYFRTEFPQSGLFIQLQKVASLIENAQPVGSRRNTLASESGFALAPNEGNRVSSSESTGSTIIRRPIPADPRSPTPVREGTFGSGNDLVGELKQRKLRTALRDDVVLKPNGDTDFDGDLNMIPPSSVSSRHSESRSPSPGILKGYELKIERQEREILQYKRLLDDQRMVLEEIQPTIDEYEANSRETEAEMSQLRHRLKEEQEQQRRQKQFFETEHEQLLAVVDELHEEIKANERRVAAGQNQAGGADANPQSKRVMNDLMRKVEYYEAAQVKWMKEKEQLKLQNDSLSAEYKALNQELLRASQNSGGESSETKLLRDKLADADMKIVQLQDLLNQKNHLRSPAYEDDTHNMQNSRSDTTDSLSMYKPSIKVDSTVRREAWCALCEKDGHESIECPYELPLVGDRTERMRSSSNDQLLF